MAADRPIRWSDFMPEPFEDQLVRIHDDHRQDEGGRLRLIAALLDDHLARFGRDAASERDRVATAFRDKNLGTEFSRRIMSFILRETKW
jgi:hypothetical protein